MHFEPDLLAIVHAESGYFVECLFDSLDGNLGGLCILVEVVGLDLDTRASAILTELNEILRGLNGLLQGLGVGMIEGLIAANAYKVHGAVVEALLHLLTLSESVVDPCCVSCEVDPNTLDASQLR